MKFANAKKFDRKSGGSGGEGPAVRPSPKQLPAALSATIYCHMETRPAPCHPEEPTSLWQVKGAMTLPAAPATKVGVPHSSPVFGLEWDTQHSTPQPPVCH